MKHSVYMVSGVHICCPYTL